MRTHRHSKHRPPAALMGCASAAAVICCGCWPHWTSAGLPSTPAAPLASPAARRTPHLAWAAPKGKALPQPRTQWKHKAKALMSHRMPDDDAADAPPVPLEYFPRSEAERSELRCRRDPPDDSLPPGSDPRHTLCPPAGAAPRNSRSTCQLIQNTEAGVR